MLIKYTEHALIPKRFDGSATTFKILSEHIVKIESGYCALMVQYYSVLPKAGYCVLITSVPRAKWESEDLYVQPTTYAHEYKGTLKIVVHNVSGDSVLVQRGSHIANLTIIPVSELYDKSQTSFAVPLKQAGLPLLETDTPQKKRAKSGSSSSSLQNIFGNGN